MPEKHDSSTHIKGPVEKSPILPGVFYGNVIFNYGQQQQVAEKAIEYKRSSKPIIRGKSPIFVGRKEDIFKIKQYLTESTAPISIIGEGGIGKSTLAFKAIHECQNMFDVIIPVYFESLLTFNSFLLKMAKGLQLPMPIDKFEQIDNEEKAQVIKDALVEYERVLIYADNYETIRNSILNKSLPTQQSRQEEKEDSIKINDFLNEVTENTYILLTSRERFNLTGERTIPLEGLNIQEGYELFTGVARNKLPKNIPIEIKKVIEEISKKTSGHPLSIEILASTYRGDLMPELRVMLEHLGAGVVNPNKAKDSRHKSLEASFEYSINKLPDTHKSLLPKLAVMFKSPFPASAVEFIFGSTEAGEPLQSVIRDLHESSLLRRIDFDEYGDVEGKYRLYHFHPSVRNYLEHKVQQEENKRQKIEEKYSEQFSQYYYKLVEETYNAIGTTDHVISLARFNIILSQGKDNDFDRAVTLGKDRSLVSNISTYLGLILVTLGIYSESLKFLRKALAIDEELQDRVGMARDYGNIGNVLRIQGNYDQALEHHKKALEIHEELQDRVGMAKDYTNIGSVFYSQNNHNQALDYHKKALAINEELQDKVGMAGDYGNIGIVLDNQGNYDQALDYHKKALEIHEELQDRVGMAKDYTNIGIVLYNQGNYDQALDYHKKALAIHEKLDDRVGMAKGYTNIGGVLANTKHNKTAAIESFSKGLEILQEFKEKTGYHHPLIDTIQGNISELQKTGRRSKRT